MRRITLLAIFLLCGIASAQQPTKPATPEVESLSAPPAVTTEIATAMQKEQEALQAYMAASQRTAMMFYKGMGEVGIKPSECVAPGQDGKPNPFACIQQDKTTGAISFLKIKPKK